MKEKLFDLIAGVGRCWNDQMYIEANGKDNYIVHLRGGVFFEIMKDEDGIHMEPHWNGPLLRCEPVDILAWITILNESKN